MAVALQGKIRERTGKSAARKLRRDNLLPGVLYGLKDNINLTVHPKELRKIIVEQGTNTLINLSLKGDGQPSRTVVMKAYQAHPLKKTWRHVDFLEIDMNKKIRVSVPIKLTGHSPGEKQDGVVNHVLKILDVECLPMDIPQVIEVPMEEVQLGQVVHVSELNLKEGLTVHNRPGDPVVSVYLQKVKAEKTEEEAEGETVEGEAVAAEGAPQTEAAEKKE